MRRVGGEGGFGAVVTEAARTKASAWEAREVMREGRSSKRVNGLSGEV